MEFWFKKDEYNKFRLPVNPSGFNMTVAHKNTVVNIHSIGDINLIGKSGLMEGNISSFFPAKEYNFSYNDSLKNPYDYVNLLLAWKEAGTPIRLIVTGTNINVEVTIESFTFGEKDATGDVEFNLQFKQYKKIAIKKATIVSFSQGTRAVLGASANSGRTYTVVSGDSLWKIAKKMYGDGSKHTKIYEANKSIIKNPSLIYPKQVLTIP